MASQILPYRRPPADTHPPNDTPAYRSTALRHSAQPLVVIPQTLSELTGPVYAYGDGTVGPHDADLTRQHAGEPLGERIVVDGTVRDGAGQPVPDALIEVWQANAAGCWNHPDDARPHPDNGRAPGPDPAFDGFGRVHTDGAGGFSLETVKPGPAPGPDGRPQAPYLLVGLFARGLLTRLVTRRRSPSRDRERRCSSMCDRAARGHPTIAGGAA